MASNTDFNDLHVTEGLAAVKTQILGAVEGLNNPELVIYHAIKKLKAGDAGAHWNDDVIDAAKELYAKNPAEFYRKRNEIKLANKESQITDWTRRIRNTGNPEEQTAKSDDLVELARSECNFTHDDQGICYATFKQGSHYEHWPIGSEGFAKHLSYKAFKELGFSPSQTIFNAVITTLKGFATHEGEQTKIYMRCAPIKDGFLIDQTNDKWSAIEVTHRGWKIIDEPGIKFIRSSTAIALPDPEKGDISLLWKHINIPEQYQTLVIAFIFESWRPDTPYTILEICGEQGSAKSTAHTRIRQLSDPNRVPLRTAPKDTQDIFVSVANNHQASFENMSNISGKMQDAMCTISTGGGFAARKLYSDSDESVIEVKRPIVINGIAPVATRPDLIDRTIHIELPKINGHIAAKELEKAFNDDYPKILGGLFETFSKSLEILPSVQVDELPRMADFVLLGEAIHQALGIKTSFKSLFLQNRTASLRRSLESSPVATAVQEFINREKIYTGTFKNLKSTLDSEYRQQGEGWPKSPKGLSEALTRSAPALFEIGIEVTLLGHKRDGSHVGIRLLNNQKTENHTVTESYEPELPDDFIDL